MFVLASDDEDSEAFIPRRRFEAELARKDRAIAELRSELAQMELDGASRRGIISEMREKNRSLEKAVARYKADVDVLASELSRAHQLNTTMRVAVAEGDDDLASVPDGASWWTQGAEWGLTQRLLVTRAVEEKRTTWRTVGCAIAQLLLEPGLRTATEVAFTSLAANIAAGMTKDDDADEPASGDVGVLRLGGDGVCVACSGTGLPNATVSALQSSLEATRVRVGELEVQKRGRRPVFIQVVSQSLVTPDPALQARLGSPMVNTRPERAGSTGGDSDDDPNLSLQERNQRWRRRRSATTSQLGVGKDDLEDRVASLRHQLADVKETNIELQVCVCACVCVFGGRESVQVVECVPLAESRFACLAAQATIEDVKTKLAAAVLAETVTALRLKTAEETAELSKSHAATVMSALDRWRTQGGAIRFGKPTAGDTEGLLTPEELEKLSGAAAPGQYADKHFKELDLCLDNAKLVNEITDVRRESLSFRVALARSNTRIAELEAVLEQAQRSPSLAGSAPQSTHAAAAASSSTKASPGGSGGSAVIGVYTSGHSSAHAGGDGTDGGASPAAAGSPAHSQPSPLSRRGSRGRGLGVPLAPSRSNSLSRSSFPAHGQSAVALRPGSITGVDYGPVSDGGDGFAVDVPHEGTEAFEGVVTMSGGRTSAKSIHGSTSPTPSQVATPSPSHSPRPGTPEGGRSGKLSSLKRGSSRSLVQAALANSPTAASLRSRGNTEDDADLFRSTAMDLLERNALLEVRGLPLSPPPCTFLVPVLRWRDLARCMTVANVLGVVAAGGGAAARAADECTAKPAATTAGAAAV